MLVLSRQKNESIMIGDDIEIVIADICGNKIKIGITAPQQVSVHRNEIWKAIQRDKNNNYKQD